MNEERGLYQEGKQFWHIGIQMTWDKGGTPTIPKIIQLQNLTGIRGKMNVLIEMWEIISHYNWF